MKLRSRMSLAAALVVAGALGIVTPVLYQAESRIVEQQFDTSLANTAQQTTQPAYSVDVKSVFVGNPGIPLSTPLTFAGDLVQVTHTPIVGGDAAGLPPFDGRDLAVFNGTAPPFTTNIDYHGAAYRMYTARIAWIEPSAPPAHNDVPVYQLVRVARQLSDETAPLHSLAILMIALACGAALAAVIVMALLAGRILRPARTLTAAVEYVTATGDLTSRPDIRTRRRGNDELSRLAASFATMMRALDDSLQAQRHLVADASHELRTPLTSLITNLDVLDEIAGDPDPLTPELVRDARAQAYELKTLVNDLVDLARYASVEAHVEDTRLDLLTEQAVNRTQTMATATTRGIRFRLHLQECLAQVDSDAVHRAIANLLDNAVKWSPAGGTIHVDLSRTDDHHAEISVRDQGPGIPPEDLPHVFDRFYRSPAARAMPGSGLGLAIVRQIAEQHRGTVHARPCSTGAHIILRVPLR